MARREYPGVYPYPAAGGRTLYRTLYNDGDGRQRRKRGFTSPSAAAKFRARMQVRAEPGELRITRETFAEHFDAWLKLGATRPALALTRYFNRSSSTTGDGRSRCAPQVARRSSSVGRRCPALPLGRFGSSGAVRRDGDVRIGPAFSKHVRSAHVRRRLPGRR